ncbi:MAG TPA: hypothetical protein VFF73_37000, partial [Planctomycetota bacterium]|nr:hypothetical protein [Planctomycetota bacterium]
PGMVLDGPRQVLVAERRDLPLLVWRKSTIAENALFPVKETAVIAVVRLETNEVHADLAFETKEPRGALPDVSKVLKGTTSVVVALDARGRLKNLPWKPGTLVARVLVHDQCSNPVTSKLVAAPVNDPAVAEFIESRRKTAYPEPVSPPVTPEANPFQKTASSPALPEGVGIALAVNRVIVTSQGFASVVHGSFRLPARPRDMVRPAPVDPRATDAASRKELQESGWVDVGDPAAKAVIPITLVATGDQNPAPIYVRVRAASYDSVDASAKEQVVTGYFSIDLQKATTLVKKPQTYALWALSGEAISAPVKMALVSEAMLPTRDD